MQMRGTNGMASMQHPTVVYPDDLLLGDRGQKLLLVQCSQRNKNIYEESLKE